MPDLLYWDRIREPRKFVTHSKEAREPLRKGSEFFLEKGMESDAAVNTRASAQLEPMHV